MEQLEKQCCALIEAADRLLDRYIKPRRRSGPSLAGRMLYPCLTMFRAAKDFIPPEDAERFDLLDQALFERLVLLGQRRVPPCVGLKQLQTRCRELLAALENVPPQWDSPSVLVGALRRPEQLDICREYRFYHVPAKQIPNAWLPFAYVAVYQSQTKFPDDCGVLFYGKVKHCKAVRRRQIREIPKNSDELYYRLEVEAWEQLQTPIEVKEIPVIHLHTNLFLLTHSRQIPELTLKTPKDYLLFQALTASLTMGDGTVLRHLGSSVRLKNGLFQVHRHGRKIAMFRVEDFTETPAAIFRELMDILEKRNTAV